MGNGIVSIITTEGNKLLSGVQDIVQLHTNAGLVHHHILLLLLLILLSAPLPPPFMKSTHLYIEGATEDLEKNKSLAHRLTIKTTHRQKKYEKGRNGWEKDTPQAKRKNRN